MTKGKKGKRSSSNQTKLPGKVQNISTTNDVTVYDYAHSDRDVPQSKTGRLHKAATNAIKYIVKDICMKPAHENTQLDWYDRDISDFDSDAEDIEHEYEHFEDKTPANSRNEQRKKNKQCITEDGENEYPLDIWFLVSNHINPEDVRCFASICSATHYISHTVQFWRGLYNRYYHRVSGRRFLPADLQPESMERQHGIRNRVVRALFYIYTPFVSHIDSTNHTFTTEPHKLLGMRCIVMWHTKTTNDNWIFYFKFKKQRNRKCNLCHTKQTTDTLDLMDGYDDVNYNPESECAILKIYSQNFVAIPITMGLLLDKVCFNVSREMRYHRLHMGFSQIARVGNNTKTCFSDISVTIDPVTRIRIFDWWEPGYYQIN